MVWWWWWWWWWWCVCVCVCVCAHFEWSIFVWALLQKIPVTSTWQAWKVVWTVYICFCSLYSPETCTIPSTLCNAATMWQMFYSKRRKTYRSGKTTQRIAFNFYWVELPAVLSVCEVGNKGVKASGLTRRIKCLLHDNSAHNEIREKPSGHSAVSK
jgi:hypothetical protein